MQVICWLCSECAVSCPAVTRGAVASFVCLVRHSNRNGEAAFWTSPFTACVELFVTATSSSTDKPLVALKNPPNLSASLHRRFTGETKNKALQQEHTIRYHHSGF